MAPNLQKKPHVFSRESQCLLICKLRDEIKFEPATAAAAWSTRHARRRRILAITLEMAASGSVLLITLGRTCGRKKKEKEKICLLLTNVVDYIKPQGDVDRYCHFRDEYTATILLFTLSMTRLFVEVCDCSSFALCIVHCFFFFFCFLIILPANHLQ